MYCVSLNVKPCRHNATSRWRKLSSVTRAWHCWPFCTLYLPRDDGDHLVQAFCSFSFLTFRTVTPESCPALTVWSEVGPHWNKWRSSDFGFSAPTTTLTPPRPLFLVSFLLETMPLHTHLPKYHESIGKSCDFICQGQDFDICNMWFSLLLMETGWVKCTTSGYVIKHTRTGPHGCAELRHTCMQTYTRITIPVLTDLKTPK